MNEILLPSHVTSYLDLLDVEHTDNPILAFGFFAFLALFFYVVAVCVVSAVLGLSILITIIAASVAVLGAGIGYAVTAHRITRKRANQLAGLSGEMLTPAAVAAFLRASRLWAPSDAIVFMTRSLGAAHKGKAIRVGPLQSFPPVTPLTVSFEPMNLNETEAPFRQVSAHANEEGMEADTINSSDKWAARGLLRNMRLNGSRFWWAQQLFWLGMGVMSLYGLGWRSWFGIFCIGIFAMNALGLTMFGQSVGHILAVPGGLLARRPLREGGWELRLFTPANSVVCCLCHSKHRWQLIVSDGKDVVRAVGTLKEMTFALQAWYSPLTPPSLDRLSDWT